MTEGQIKAALGTISCSKAGCKTKHQASFLQEKAEIPKQGKIALKKSGTNKNAGLRWALLVKQKELTKEDHRKIFKGKGLLSVSF